MRILIIDDEKLARSRLRRMLDKYKQIQIVGEARNGKEALKMIRDTRPDVLFLDIRMPMLSGFEMLERLKSSPYIVFTTAYDQYALRAFDENTVDYLLKPISDEKLDRAISRLSDIVNHGKTVPYDLEKLIQILRQKEERMKRFSVRVGDRILLIPDNEIAFFQAEDKYTFLNTSGERYIVPFTLKELEARLDPDLFVRVHRAFIVNIEHISSMERWFGGKIRLKMKNEKEVAVTSHYMKVFKERIHL